MRRGKKFQQHPPEKARQVCVLKAKNVAYKQHDSSEHLRVVMVVESEGKKCAALC